MDSGNSHDPDIERVVVSAEQIRDKIDELARQVAADYANVERLLLVGVLKGAVMFMADFARALAATPGPRSLSSWRCPPTASGPPRRESFGS